LLSKNISFNKPPQFRFVLARVMIGRNIAIGGFPDLVNLQTRGIDPPTNIGALLDLISIP
jgi:hypothetical protein